MKKGLMLGLVLLLVFVPAVSAIQTEIIVYTEPYHDLTVAILAPSDQYSLIKSFPDIYSTDKGVVTVVYEGDELDFNINVIGKRKGALAFQEKFGPFDAGGTIELDLPEGSKTTREDQEAIVEDIEDTNSSEELEDTNSTEDFGVVENVEEAQGDGDISGNIVASDGFSGSLSKILYYVLGILVVAGIVGFVAGKMIRSRKEKMGVVVPKAEKVKFKKEESSGGMTDKELQEAEEKLRQAQAEISRIKNKDKIKEAEEKLRKDREDLERLRRGED